MADSTSWLRRFQQSRAQPPKHQSQPIITSASEDSFVTSVTTIDHGNGGNASPLSHHSAAATNNKHHINNGGGIRVVSNAGGETGNGSGSGSGSGGAFGGNATGSGPLPQMPPPPPPKTPTAGVFSSGAGGASSAASLRRPSLPHQKSPSDSNVNGTTSSRLLRSRPSATFQRVSSLLNLGGGGGGAGGGNGTNSPLATTAPSSPSFSSGRPREGSGGSTSRFTFFRPLTPSAAAAPAPSLSALPLSNWSATNGEDEDDWLGGLRRNAARESPWHNPNLMQMAETLQAVMMAKGDSMAALPAQYNSLVHNVLEGFAHLTKRLQALEQELAELKNLREKELEQFRGISEEWIQREDGYKAEIKRLEVVLAKESKDGLASVTLARQDTLIDRSGSKRFQARLKRMSTTADRDRAGESDNDGDKVTTRDGTRYGIRQTSLRNLPVDNDIRISQLVKKRAAEDKRRDRSLLQQSMPPPPSVSVEETSLDSSSPSPPSPTKPYNGLRSSHSQHTGSLDTQVYSPSTSSSSTASTASPDATRSLSQRRNINHLVIETGDVSTAVNPRQRRIFSYIEGEAEVLATASDDRQHPFQDYYEFANTFRQQEGQSNSQSPTDTDGIGLPNRVSVSAVRPTAEELMDKASASTLPAEDESTTPSMGTSSRSSNLTGLTPSNSTGSVIWVGKRNSRAAAEAAAAITTSLSSTTQVGQPSHYETSVGGVGVGVGIALGGGNYELGDMPSTTTEATLPSASTAEVPISTHYHYYPTTTTMATSPRLGPGPGPAIPPRTTSHQQSTSTAKFGRLSPIKDRFEQFHQLEQQQQKQSRSRSRSRSRPRNGGNERSPVRETATAQKKRDRTNSPSKNKNSNVSATVEMFNEGT